MNINDTINNMIFELKNKERTPELKKSMEKKYSEIYELSEKLFDKIYTQDLLDQEIAIIKKMISVKIQKDKGFINKLNADKQIGETLCDVYVKPMLNKTNEEQ